MIANPNDGNSPRVEVATPMIDVSAGGLITATTEQEKGYVPGGTKSATQQLTTQGAATITPTTTNQTAVASGRYTTGDVVVSGDANLVPENIAEGVSIFGITGTHSGGGTFDGATVTFTDITSFGGVLVYALNPQLEVVSLNSSGTLTIAVGTIVALSFSTMGGMDVAGDVEVLYDSYGMGVVYVNGNGTITVFD